MKKRRSGKGLLVLIVLLFAALVTVLSVIGYKQYQYGVSNAYYESLRQTGG